MTTNTTNENWSLMLFRDTFEYLTDGFLSEKEFCELMRCIYYARNDGIYPDESEMSKNVGLIWKTFKHTIKRAVTNAKYYKNKTEAAEKPTVKENAKNSPKCEQYVTAMRDIIQRAKSATDSEIAALTEEFNEAKTKACEVGTEKQREKLIPALAMEFQKAANRKIDAKLPDWMIQQLPMPTKYNAKKDAVRYIQIAEQLLKDESNNEQYADRVYDHKHYMLFRLFDIFAPAIVEDFAHEGKNITKAEVEDRLVALWNKVAKDFKFDDCGCQE